MASPAGGAAAYESYEPDRHTSIPTNLLFFDRSGPTREIWYYEHPLPVAPR